MKRILIIGATSAIAIACARRWTENNNQFYLVGRNDIRLEQIKQDLLVRGASSVAYEHIDMTHYDKHQSMINNAWEILKEIDIVLIAHGTLPNQQACEQDVSLTLKEISTNGLSVISILTLIANKIESQKKGTIAVITSVAADRGRPTNYVYGCAKAVVNTFCEGLRSRLYKSGVHLLTIKPGFVDTPMTHGLALPKILVAQPEKVSQDIIRAINKKKNSIYTPWFWVGIMQIIRRIPEFIFKRVSL